MKIIRSLLLLIIVIAVILFFAFDNIVKSVISKQGSQTLNTPVSVANVQSSFANKSMEIKLIEVQNLRGFKAKNALKIDSFKVVLGENISTDLIDVNSITIDGVVATLEQNDIGLNLQMLTSDLKNSPNNNNSQEIKPAVNNEKVVDIKIKNISILNSKFIIDTKIIKEEITLSNLNLDNINANNKNISAVIIKILLDEVQDMIEKKGVNIAKDKLEKSLLRKISEKTGLEGGTLDSLKEQAKNQIKENTDKIKDKVKDKLKNMFKF
jgi:hypothetical protein